MLGLGIRKHFLIGSLFLILGVATWSYANYVIVKLEGSLNSGLTQEELWNLSGSLEWWKILRATTLNPISAVLICIGVIFIVYWLAQIALPITIEWRRQ